MFQECDALPCVLSMSRFGNKLEAERERAQRPVKGSKSRRGLKMSKSAPRAICGSAAAAGWPAGMRRRLPGINLRVDAVCVKLLHDLRVLREEARLETPFVLPLLGERDLLRPEQCRSPPSGRAQNGRTLGSC